MEYKFTNEEINVDELKRNGARDGKYVNIIRDFLKTDAKKCIIACSNKHEYDVTVACVRAYLKRNDTGLCFYHKPYKVYLIRG